MASQQAHHHKREERGDDDLHRRVRRDEGDDRGEEKLLKEVDALPVETQHHASALRYSAHSVTGTACAHRGGCAQPHQYHAWQA
jgi:hypothetical protein